MAISLKNPPATETTSGDAKKYLDYAGLNALWDNICDKFAPQWKSVNFDHIAKSSPTQTDNSVVLTFQNLSMPPVTEGEFTGVVDHTHVNQTTWTIAAAQASENGEGGHAGVMTAADKAKLDALDNTLGSVVDTAIKINEIRIGNTKAEAYAEGNDLKVEVSTDTDYDKTKAVAFGLDYNAETDSLSIVDFNNGNKALSTVHVLGGALQNAFIEDVALVNTNDDNEPGTFIKITFVTVSHGDDHKDTTTTKIIYLDVDDLISVYTAGGGIDISQQSTGLDGETTSTTISVIAPTTGKIGGIIPKKVYASNETLPTVQPLGTQSKRYFGIETDAAGNAFVNAPSAAVTNGTNTTDQGNVNNVDAPGSFTAITGVDITLSEDGSTYTYTTNKTTYTVAKESKLEIGSITDANADTFTVTNSDGVVDADSGHKITYINKVQVKDHTIDFETGEYTLKETPITINADTAAESIVLTPGASESSVTVLKTITKDGHHVIQKEDVAISVANPAAIDIDYIEGLQWVVPIKKQYYPNETVATEPEE